MINYIYQLVSPQVLSVEYTDITPCEDKIILRPLKMSVCQADIRYYFGLRSRASLAKKLPMALIHECCAEVVYDPTGTYKPGQTVIPVPNVPTHPEREGFFENYSEQPHFLSSGYDGFMREYVEMPVSRVVPADCIKNHNVAAFCELVSVAVHAFDRFDRASHSERKNIGIWGDGSVAYCLACVIKSLMPECNLTVIGRNQQKLDMYTFADRVYADCDLPDDFSVDHAFECCGGEGSADAIDGIIAHIKPQGTVILMGVSENKVGVLTRMVLEKGLTLVGVSRSGKRDFERAVEIISDGVTEGRLSLIAEDYGKVSSMDDIHAVFNKARTGLFKTVFDWNL